MIIRRNLSYKKLISWYSGLVKGKSPEAPFDHVIQIGDPTLRTKSQEIPEELIKSKEINFLIAKMKAVMKKYNCVGLSAPQIGIPLRVFLLEVNDKKISEYTVKEREIQEIQTLPLTVVINPEIKITDYTKIKFTESCASVKGLQAEVPRFRSLKLTSYTDNDKITTEYTGWTARIIQHELDHLNGQVYTDIMERKSLACSCWQVINERGGKVELPYGPH